MDNQRVWQSYTRSLRLRDRRPKTIESYGWTFQALTRWTTSPVVELDRLELEAFIEHRMEQVGMVTVAKNVRDLKAFFNWCVAEELVLRSPMTRIPMPSVDQGQPQVLTAGEVGSLLTVCKGKTFNSRRDTAMLRLLLTVGSPRLSELVGMSVDAVDLTSDLVSVDGKTGPRSFPLPLKAGRALELYLRARDHHRCSERAELWLGLHGPIGRNGVAQILNRRAAQAGITWKLHPHSFRHTVASMAAEAGLADSLMEPLMGWKPNSGMTRIYGRSTRVRRAQEAARRLGDLS